MNTKRVGNVAQLVSCVLKGLLLQSRLTSVLMEEVTVSMQLERTIGINHTSPASSSGSDDDAVNTTQARVYFGPLQSPEKKLIQVGNPTPFIPRALPHDTNRYRSESFPSPFRTQDQEDNSDVNNESDEAAEDVSHSRSGTPDNIRFPPDGEYHVLTHWLISATDSSKSHHPFWQVGYFEPMTIRHHPLERDMSTRLHHLLSRMRLCHPPQGLQVLNRPTLT